MKRILCTSGILLTLLLSSISGQHAGDQKSPPKFSFEDECGDPLMESMVWSSVSGTVVRIIDGDSFELRTEDGGKRIVKLVAIDVSSPKYATSVLLSDMLLNRKVDVLVNPSNDKAHTLIGVVHLGSEDVNRELLEIGAAQYKTPEAYAVSEYTACVYRVVERKAREAGKGIWRHANH